MAIIGRDKSENINDPKGTSIRGQILGRVLPLVLIPLLGLGLVSILGIFLIQQRTDDAISSSEQILTDRIGDTATRSADGTSRDVAEFVDDFILRVTRANDRSLFREVTVDVSNSPSGDTTVTEVLALTVLEEITVDESDVQVLIVAEDGRSLGSTHNFTLDDYADAEWFQQTLSQGQATRSFVNDDEHVPSFEIAVRTQPPATTAGAAVLRVRVPLVNLHPILNRASVEDDVTVALLDRSASVVLGDTLSNHDQSILFGAAPMTAVGSSVNPDLLEEGLVLGDEVISAADPVVDTMSNELGASFDWLTQTSQSLDVAEASLNEIRSVSSDVSNQRTLIILAVVGLLALSLVMAIFAVRSVANRITAPVKALSDQARSAADSGIPAVVEAARASEELPHLEEFEVSTNDELAVLATSLNTMQDAAVDLAAGQAKLRRQNVARTFVSLGRRNQNLLNRQLEFIEELEQQESDPDSLENLFRLDHLATRMRRNAENLLVLAGEQTPRRWGRPIAVRDVLRAAASEIADYRRVKLGGIDSATVSGNLATDLSHLIAELLENAGSFSPPNTPIEVLGQQTQTHYRLAIVDHGIGMDDAALTQANERLRNPLDFSDAPSAYLGLFVVGRLAHDLGITVRLANADPTRQGLRRGTIAFVDLPVELLSTEAATPIEISERNAEAMAKLNSENDSAPNGALPVSPARKVNSSGRPADPDPAPESVPTAPPAPEPAIATAPEEQAPAQTAAGFPKRNRGNKSPAPESAPSEAAPAVAVPTEVQPPGEPPAPVADAPTAPVAEASTAPVAPATELTSAGFPKRSRGTANPVPTDISTPTPPPAAETPGPRPERDAAAVSESLRAVRAAVARGRAEGPPGTPAPVPGAPAAGATPTVPEQIADETNKTATPTPTGSES